MGILHQNCSRLLGTLLLLSVFSGFTSLAHAQGGGALQKDILDDSMTDIYIVTGTTLTGGLLGLSTLSFVPDSSAHLKNIVVGGSLGVILGVAIVAWRQAYKSKDYYYQNAAAVPVAADSLAAVRRPSQAQPLQTAFIGPQLTFQF